MEIKVMINGKNASNRTALPIKWNELLDERLDECRLSLRYTNTRLFPIGAPVTITVDEFQRDFIIAADESTEIPVGSGKYNHELSLIEHTKLLEGIIVESLTFTNNLGRNFTDNPSTAAAYVYSLEIKGLFGDPHWTDKRYITTPQEVTDLMPKINAYLSPVDTTKQLVIKPINEQIIPSSKGKFGEYYYKDKDGVEACPKLTVISPSGEKYEKKNYNEGITINNPELGVWSLYYNYYYEPMFGQGTPYRIEYTITVAKNEKELPKWNIASVIDRVLNLCEPHLVSVKPRYKLDPAQRKQFEAIEAPEFAFTNMTLKEILDQIGGFIHGIPRLVKGESGEFDTIHYDMLGGTEFKGMENYPYISEILSQNIEDYATDLDSSIDNLVNTLNADEGAITEPYSNGFKSVRSEEAYARIEEGNMVISTSLPIYSVQKLEVVTPENKIVGDLTPYVFEGAEYGRLSSFDGAYPSSKAFAIYYNLGEKNIKGLGFKTPHVFGDTFADYAITNIIYAATGEKIDTVWWGEDKAGKYPRLAFRITYTPIFSARILQHKPYIEPNALQRTLAYNQGANLVETRYYGENLKGTIARMGNVELVRTYRTRKGLAVCPTIGQLMRYNGDEYYITSVTIAVYADSLDFTVGFSKDFNRLSQYIGINSEWRAYEVSERKAYNRDMVYRDFCVVGDPVEPNGLSLIGYPLGVNYIINTFAQRTENQGDSLRPSEPITCAVVTTFDGYTNGAAEYNVALPVVSTAFGNAMVFSFGMADNYSAGAKSVQQDPNNEVTGYWQTDVPYVDYYGRIAIMKFALSRGGKTTTAGDKLTFDLPQYNSSGSSSIISTPDWTSENNPNGIDVDKNGTEIIRFNYQLEFVTNWKDLIIGSALTRNCPMVSGVKETESDGTYTSVHSAKLYVLRARVGKFDSKIDVTTATPIYDYSEHIPIYDGDTGSEVKGYISLGGEIKSTVSGKAWAIADKTTGEILLARNIDIREDGDIEMPYFSFTHNLRR